MQKSQNNRREFLSRVILKNFTRTVKYLRNSSLLNEKIILVKDYKGRIQSFMFFQLNSKLQKFGVFLRLQYLLYEVYNGIGVFVIWI